MLPRFDVSEREMTEVIARPCATASCTDHSIALIMPALEPVPRQLNACTATTVASLATPNCEPAAVEALPAAGALGALWLEQLALGAVAQLVRTLSPEDASATALLLEGLDSAATTLRPAVPAVLVGPHGDTVESIAAAVTKFDEVLRAADEAPRAGKARKAFKK